MNSCILNLLFVLLLSSCLQSKTIEDDQPFYTTSPRHQHLTSRKEVCEQDGGKWQEGSCSKTFSYLANERICQEQSARLVWDGDRCVERASQLNFFRLCNESLDVEIRRFINAVRHLFNDASCEGSFVRLKTKVSLSLEDKFLKSLVPLSGLNHFESLNLRGNQISDVSILADMAQLKLLDLDGNKVSDISGFQNLVELESLYLKNNPVYDLSPLENLSKLKEIDIGQVTPKNADKYTCPKNAKSKALSEICMIIENMISNK